eukprot:EG_transcript_1794
MASEAHSSASPSTTFSNDPAVAPTFGDPGREFSYQEFGPVRLQMPVERQHDASAASTASACRRRPHRPDKTSDRASIRSSLPRTSEDFYFCCIQRPSLWHTLERQLKESVDTALSTWSRLMRFEDFFGYPGAEAVRGITQLIKEEEPLEPASAELQEAVARVVEQLCTPPRHSDCYAFDVLVLIPDGGTSAGAKAHNINLLAPLLRQKGESWTAQLRAHGDDSGALKSEVVCVHTFVDVLVALLINPRIQSVVLCDMFMHTDDPDDVLEDMVLAYAQLVRRFVQYAQTVPSLHVISTLVVAIKSIRPQLDVFMVSERVIDHSELYLHIRRSFFPTEDFYAELHAAIVAGVRERQRMPFFTALQEFTQRPFGVSSLAISRGSSLLKSHWLGDFLDFYGMPVFQAESGFGGLGELMSPTGSLEEAQRLAAVAFGSTRTFFVTNGASSANKIVIQALVRPGDIVLLPRNCHVSHYYATVHAGALPAYLDPYPLPQYTLHGGVPLRSVKQALLEYKRRGLLQRVRLLVLTNCTMDGIVYNVHKVMEECLAIKPDLCFLWDEAWFAYATFNPVLRRRTGMFAAKLLARILPSEHYQAQSARFWAEYGSLMESNDEADHRKLLGIRLFPKVAGTVIRVYVTQATHKSLTAFRQGGMIHVIDQRFKDGTERAFLQAYHAHTSTSPNYQILASLDAGRSQMHLEGFELVLEMLEHAMALRKHVGSSALITAWLQFLDVADLIPAEYRDDSHVHSYWDAARGCLTRFEAVWLSEDEFVLDPTRLTLSTAAAGLSGEEFEAAWMLSKCDIQVDKTSRNAVLFQTNIGTTFSSVMYLLHSLRKCIHEFDLLHGTDPSAQWHERVKALQASCAFPKAPPFHPAFALPGTDGREGDVRRAFYEAYDEAQCEYVTPADARQRLAAGEALAVTEFLQPLPGFGILAVPGQQLTVELLDFVAQLLPAKSSWLAGAELRLFAPTALARVLQDRPAAPTTAGASTGPT